MRSTLLFVVAGLLPAFLPADAAALDSLLIGPTSLEFTWPDGATQPLPQSIFVASSGPGLHFEAHATSKWLFVSQVWGATPSMLSVSVDATGLAAAGVYRDYI